MTHPQQSCLKRWLVAEIRFWRLYSKSATVVASVDSALVDLQKKQCTSWLVHTATNCRPYIWRQFAPVLAQFTGDILSVWTRLHAFVCKFIFLHRTQFIFHKKLALPVTKTEKFYCSAAWAGYMWRPWTLASYRYNGGPYLGILKITRKPCYRRENRAMPP